MKNHIYKFYTLLLFTISLISCESMIDIDLPNDQINTEDVFKEYHTTKAALSNIYVSIRQKSLFTGNSSGMGNALGLYTDDLVSYAQPNSASGIYEINNNTLLSSNSTISSLWRNTYETIYSINAFIEGLNASPYIETKQKEELLSQAYLLRALLYQYLTQLFGDIPYITTTDYKQNTIASKSNYQQVLSFVESDLLKALSGLTYTYDNKERIYPNKSVAELLLAKNYLLQKDYTQAFNYATKVVENPLYKIEENLDRVFKKDAMSTLWQLSPNSPGEMTYEARNYYIATAPPTTQSLSESIIRDFESKDLRKQKWITTITKNNQTWYAPYKYKNIENNTNEYSIIFRIEEAHFVLIEALAYQDKIDEALAYLNKIRQRANLDPINQKISKDDFIKMMLQESRKEFFTEHGHRFLDLKRNNMLSTLAVNKVNWEQKHTLFPYPESELEINKNLKPQNYGY